MVVSLLLPIPQTSKLLLEVVVARRKSTPFFSFAMRGVRVCPRMALNQYYLVEGIQGGRVYSILYVLVDVGLEREENGKKSASNPIAYAQK